MNNDYLAYSTEDFASDQAFIDWVKSPTAESDSVWQNWLSDHPNKKEEVGLARSLVQHLRFSDVESQTNVDQLWSRIQSSISHNGESRAVRRRAKILQLFVTAIAAGFALLFVFRLLLSSEIKLETAYGQDLVYVLPDQSSIHLNDGSTISFDEKDYNQRREIYMKGEAFFEVEKGQPFVVITDRGSIEVLGTSFNVYSRNNGFEVHCQTGSVEVNNNNDGITLVPGQFASYDDGVLKKSTFDGEKEVLWQEGIFRYEQEPLGNVLAELKRQFDIAVKIDKSLLTETYTGFFTDVKLEDALNSICWPLKLSTKITGKTVEIKSDATH